MYISCKHLRDYSAWYKSLLKHIILFHRYQRKLKAATAMAYGKFVILLLFCCLYFIIAINTILHYSYTSIFFMIYSEDLEHIHICFFQVLIQNHMKQEIGGFNVKLKINSLCTCIIICFPKCEHFIPPGHQNNTIIWCSFVLQSLFETMLSTILIFYFLQLLEELSKVFDTRSRVE